MKKSHVLAALLVLMAAAAATAAIGRGADGAITPTIAGAANALIFGIVPCSTGRLINVATAPPFPNADLELLCDVPSLSSRSRTKSANVAEKQRQSRGSRSGPVSASAATTVWANARAGITGDFTVALGVIRNGSDGSSSLLYPMLLADQCRVAVTTPLAACDVSLAGVTGTLSAPIQVLTGVSLPGIYGGLLGLAAGPFSFVA